MAPGEMKSPRKAPRKAPVREVATRKKAAPAAKTQQSDNKKPASATKKKRVGKHLFQPGQSGNPGGRPKGMVMELRALQELCRAHAEEAVAELLKIARDIEGTPVAVRVNTWENLLSRGFGKPNQPVTGEDGGPVDMSMTVTFVGVEKK